VSLPQAREPEGGRSAPWRELPARIWASVFRSPIVPRDDLGRMQAVGANFFFHLHASRVQGRSLRVATTLGLGLATLVLFALLCSTGIMLMFVYVPAPEQAFGRMLDLRGAVAYGPFVRNLHRWSAHGMVVAAIAHMARVFLTGSHKKPREFNWVVGVGLLLLTLALSFTGYLLPWDQLAYWAIVVGTSMANYIPGIGQDLRRALLGDEAVGPEALLRFYVLHVALLPVLTATLVGLHLWRVRRDGGLARPRGEPVGADVVLAWPHALSRELAVALGVLLVLGATALAWDAPLEPHADPNHPPNPAKSLWYFLGLQELVSHSAFVGGVAVPAVTLLLMLAAPYLERSPGGEGEWLGRKRWLPNAIFVAALGAFAVLTLVGSTLRGANWAFVMPW